MIAKSRSFGGYYFRAFKSDRAAQADPRVCGVAILSLFFLSHILALLKYRAIS